MAYFTIISTDFWQSFLIFVFCLNELHYALCLQSQLKMFSHECKSKPARPNLLLFLGLFYAKFQQQTAPLKLFRSTSKNSGKGVLVRRDISSENHSSSENMEFKQHFTGTPLMGFKTSPTMPFDCKIRKTRTITIKYLCSRYTCELHVHIVYT